tara:strand:- start:4983 stop:6038 length:1056 start_codon:yes stop_codon:yes gene_type:complete
MKYKNWKKIILKNDNTISNVIKNLNKSSAQIVLVENKNKKFLGTITDGDIRRGLSRGLSLKSNIIKIVNKSPITVNYEISKLKAKKIMNKNSISHLPILDKYNSKIKGIIILKDISSEEQFFDNPVVIMAGGKGQRLWPITKNCPKPLLKINGETIIEKIIKTCRRQGFKNFRVSINYLGKMIENYLQEGKKLDSKIEYIKEKKFLGTGGSLSLIKNNSVKKSPLVVINGDILVNINFKELIDFHIKNKSKATMVVRKSSFQNPYGEVKLQNMKITKFDEKPIRYFFANSGIYCIDFDCLKNLKKNTYYDMPDIFKLLQNKKLKVLAYPLYEEWEDIGDLATYNRISRLEK